MKKNLKILFILILSFFVFSCSLENRSAIDASNYVSKPNILILLTDDQSYNTINALGNKEVSTPNIDKLVSNGLTFTHAHIMGSFSGAVCMPSRAMLMTGRYVQNLSKVSGAIDIKDKTMPEVLKSAGYTTFETGKWHNGRQAFAKSFTNGANIFMGGMSNHLKVPLHDFDETGEYPKSKTKYEDKFSSVIFREAAVDFLENYKQEKPFFAYVSFTSPHDPRMAPDDYQKKYNTSNISLPKNFFPKHPFDNGELIIRDENLLPFPRTKEAVKEEIAAYYAMISEVDDNIGKILNVMEETGHADNTIIIFTSDNGLAVGQHGLLGKQNLYDHSVRVPLIISGPGIKNGERTESLVYLNDVFPTVADIVGIEKPETIDGLSLLPILKDSKATVRESVYFSYKNFQRGVRTKNWKLIKYLVEGKKTTQLFEIKKDPLEINNLANDPKYKKKVEEMTVLLQEWMNKSGDKVQLGKPDWDVKVIKSWVTERKEKGLSLDSKGVH
ncbi:sulfatase-like hydrolase/transferase [Flavobacteriaceae bacterium]|nr:sulfatase-like hydrolase/transferase [Flavobacteriaceae bacterium]